MSLSRVLDTARGEIGYGESPPGSNRTKYGAEFGLDGVPWCVIFLWWVFRKAGEAAAFFAGARTASCGTLLRWYREQGLTVPVELVQPGDIVILNFHGTQDTEHCGIVTETPRQNGQTVIYTIEGNTSVAGSQDAGGRVMAKLRHPSQVVAVLRPQYKPEEPQTIDDITNHWAEPSIRRAIDKGLMQGYPDGSWKPEQPVTRAELAVILDRLEGQE